MSSGAVRTTRGATRDDVARLAGVSSAVVSYVVNNGPRPVAEATRQRVLDAIDKLGYRPNAAARSLIASASCVSRPRRSAARPTDRYIAPESR